MEDSGGTSKLLWDLENILLETDAGDVTQVVNTLEPEQYGNQISQRRSAATHYYHFDGLGSTDRLTNASETVTDSYVYKAFGVAVTATGSTINPFRYVGMLGYYYDTITGLYHVRARWLRDETGRWMSRDPLGFADGTNLYLYVGSNPITRENPSGLQSRWFRTLPPEYEEALNPFSKPQIKQPPTISPEWEKYLYPKPEPPRYWPTWTADKRRVFDCCKGAPECEKNVWKKICDSQ